MTDSTTMDPETPTTDTVSRLADLLQQQIRSNTELLQEQARTNALREERMLAIAEQMSQNSASQPPSSARPDENGGSTETAAANTSTSSTRSAPSRLGAMSTPAPRLHEGASLREFTAWREKFNGYALLTGLTSHPQVTQTAALTSLLDDQWTRTLRHGLDVDINASDTKTILDSMERHLRGQQNIILDRREFYRRQQDGGESFDDYLVALREIAQFCDFCSHRSDLQLRDRIVTGIRDEETLRALLSENDLTLQTTISICRARENAEQNSTAISSRIQPVSAYRRNRTASARRPTRPRWDSPQQDVGHYADNCPNCMLPSAFATCSCAACS